MEQRSEELYKARKGRFTASQIHKLMGARGLGQTGESYILEVVTQSLGVELLEFSTYAMQYGTDMEPIAKQYYEAAFQCEIEEHGFIVPDWCDQTGASPDGLVKGKNKLIEIKCPYNPVNHTKNLLIKSVDDLKANHKEYYWQIQHQLACTGLQVCDFVSFHPEFTGINRMIAIEIHRNEKDIDLMKTRIFEAVALFNKFIETINK